jgi:hypothetical protein
MSSRDGPGGCLLTGQVVSGVQAARARSAALAWNVGRPVSIRLWLVVVLVAVRGSAPTAETGGVEYRCGIGWRTGS